MKIDLEDWALDNPETCFICGKYIDISSSLPFCSSLCESVYQEESKYENCDEVRE